jgi:hypothetical protein
MALPKLGKNSEIEMIHRMVWQMKRKRQIGRFEKSGARIFGVVAAVMVGTSMAGETQCDKI